MSMSGAEYLASIYGTEKDKVNCSFYIKTGACRHSERCSRKHNKPQYSQTVVMQNMYVSQQNSAKSADGSHLANMSDHEIQEQFEYFFEDVFFECEEKYGEIEEMCVCDNQCDHLRGNVYIKFRREEDAVKAAEDLNNRWYMFRPIYCDLCPVADFREACCRQFEMGQCGKGGFCNFWHVKPISHHLKNLLARSSRSRYRHRSRSHSRSRERHTEKHEGKHEGGKHRRRSRSRSRDRDRRDRRGRY
ncbi:splicing factor U2AF 35 kDa subunit-like [Eriocheir sinensis]|uniref:splicing factor U2AF 35 kDa subunit-like n=1 Tax=Eriocheir sinensis TaxID=95602 RepID=UPI0021C72986|nr:splicing factor U2AF 35 kDa subunit-like [Eriocheir sinensis]